MLAEGFAANYGGLEYSTDTCTLEEEIMDPLAMEDTLPSMWQNHGLVLSILGAMLVLQLVHNADVSSEKRAVVKLARRLMLYALLASYVGPFMFSNKYGEIVRATCGYAAQLVALLGVLSLLEIGVQGVKDAAQQQAFVTTGKAKARLISVVDQVTAACLRQRRLSEANDNLLEMKENMTRQLEVINSLKKTWTETIVWTGLSLFSSGCSKVVQIPLEYSRSKQKRQATKEFKQSQMKAADIYYCYIEREGGSEADLVDLPNSGPDKLLLTKEEWLTQRCEQQLL